MSVAPYQHCFVAGAGAWGTALAIMLARGGRRVTLWTRLQSLAESINKDRENRAYLPGVRIPDGVTAVAEPSLLDEADAMLLCVPAQFIREQIGRFVDAVDGKAIPMALCSKGIEQATGKTVHDVVAELWPRAQLAVLSGPSFAADVAHGRPAAVTLADTDRARGDRWLATLATPTFRPYYSDDVLGAELGGAIKNVLAIACGVVEGSDLGDSARAAVMTRGFAEAVRFATARGAKAETLNGLSGLGDIILTCSSRQSRNFSLGFEIGQGRAVDEILAERRTVAEGVATAPVLLRLANEIGVEMPVVNAVATLLDGQQPLKQVITDLLTRPLKPER